MAKQRTLKETVSCSGLGVHSGKKVRLTIHAAPINHGIQFKRTDLPDNPVVRAHFNSVVDTSLATVIGADGFIVSTIEHLMASFVGCAIDNALVEIDSYELPIMDGSALDFTHLLRSAGVANQDGPRMVFRIKEPISLVEGGRSVVLYPADAYKITCNIEYSHPLIGSQTLSITVQDDVFEREICRARTFGFLADYEQLKRFGLSKGCSLDNVVVVDTDRVVNADGLRYDDEFVRHKILDCIGDFSLLGMPIMGHVVATKTGHAFNHAFIRKFFSAKHSWETAVVSDLSVAV